MFQTKGVFNKSYIQQECITILANLKVQKNAVLTAYICTFGIKLNDYAHMHFPFIKAPVPKSRK